FANNSDEVVTMPSIGFDPVSAESMPDTSRLSRRGFLRTAVVAGGGLIAAGVAACAPTAGAPTWTFPPAAPAVAGEASSLPEGSQPAPSAAHDHASASPSGSAGLDHDAVALAVVKRFLEGEYGKVEGAGNQPLVPRVEGNTKV